MVYHTRVKLNAVLFHFDQGTQHTSRTFAESVVSCDGMTQIVSRLGNCQGNEPTEHFFISFKTEQIPKSGYEDIAETSNAINDYMWGYY